MSATLVTGHPLPAWAVPDLPAAQTGHAVRMAEVLSALSYALDLSTGQPIGHSVRACILAMRIGQEIGLPASSQMDLYFAALLKDAGCSSNASKMYHAFSADDLKAKRDVKTTDWTRASWETLHYALTHVATGKPFIERVRVLARMALHQKGHGRQVTKIRCERGATIARMIGLSGEAADAIASLDEHWDGQGQPSGLIGREIPILSQVILLAQTLEVFSATQGPEPALQVAKQRARKWFDPAIVKGAQSLAARNALWTGVATDAAFNTVLEMDPRQLAMRDDDKTMDAICIAFAEIVDAKSPFTYRHSNGVANAAVAIARTLQLDPERILFIRHASLLHDLGKLSVSNTILEKPAKLDAAEWQVMRMHPFYTWKVLNAITGFSRMSETAASHHEKLDGSGYFRGLTAAQLSLDARIIVVADIFDALSAKRPYRDALPPEAVLGIMRKDAPHAIDAGCLEALEQAGVDSDQTFVDLVTLNEKLKTPAADHVHSERVL